MTWNLKHPQRIFARAALTLSSLIVLSVGNFAATAADLRVLSTGGIIPLTDELFSQFERLTGHKVTVRYGFGPTLNREIAAGAAFDAAVLSVDVEGLVKQGKIVEGTRVVIGRMGIGVGISAGAVKPDISTTEAFKRTLLNAKSVAHSGGASGAYVLSLLERLGIANEMRSKLRLTEGEGRGVEIVATGGAELAVYGVAPLLLTPGVELVGWLPPELRSYVLPTGGVSTTAKGPETAGALLHFLTTLDAKATLKAKGVDPAP
jgi:molybdate transport system substrate-binding protein